ncbi:MAG: V-type ATPase subunit [Nitrososphaerota archaeon]
MDSGYVYALAFSVKGRLLGRRDLEELASSKSVEDFVAALRATHYFEALTSLPQRPNARVVERALWSHLYRYHVRLLRLTGWSPVLWALYERHLFRAMKALVRGMASRLPQEDLMREVDTTAAELVEERDVFARALASRDFQELLGSVRGTRFEGAVSRALALYERTGDPAAIDLEFDREAAAGFTRAIGRLRGWDRRWLAWAFEWHLNSLAVETVLRGKEWGFEQAELRRAIEGIRFTVPRQVLEVLLESKDVDEVSRALQLIEGRSVPRISARSSYGEMAGELRERGWRSAVERFRKLYLTSVSHLVLAVGSLMLIEEEVRKLAGICAGIELGMPKNKLLETIAI